MGFLLFQFPVRSGCLRDRNRSRGQLQRPSGSEIGADDHRKNKQNRGRQAAERVSFEQEQSAYQKRRVHDARVECSRGERGVVDGLLRDRPLRQRGGDAQGHPDHDQNRPCRDQEDARAADGGSSRVEASAALRKHRAPIGASNRYRPLPLIVTVAPCSVAKSNRPPRGIALRHPPARQSRTWAASSFSIVARSSRISRFPLGAG